MRKLAPCSWTTRFALMKCRRWRWEPYQQPLRSRPRAYSSSRRYCYYRYCCRYCCWSTTTRCCCCRCWWRCYCYCCSASYWAFRRPAFARWLASLLYPGCRLLSLQSTSALSPLLHVLPIVLFGLLRLASPLSSLLRHQHRQFLPRQRQRQQQRRRWCWVFVLSRWLHCGQKFILSIYKESLF